MNFREGLLHIYKNRRTDGEITDPFYLYCKLSDLCSGSYADKEKVELFYAIDKRLCIFETLIKNGGNGKKELLNAYMVVSDLLNEGSFAKLIDCATWVMSPNACLPVAVQPQPQARAIPQQKKVQPAVVHRAEESRKQETRTPLQTPSFSWPIFDEVEGFLGVGFILLVLSVFVGIFGILVGACKWNIPWLVWQWIIGIVGGGWITLLLALLTYLLDDSITCEYTVFGFICVGVMAVVNFLLLVFLRGNYKAIFGCFSVWTMIGSVILAVICFDDVEDEFGWGYIIAGAVVLIAMILGLIFFW